MCNFLCLFKRLNITSYKFINGINNEFFNVITSHLGTLDLMASGIVFYPLSKRKIFFKDLKKRYLFFIKAGFLFSSIDFDSKFILKKSLCIFFKIFLNFFKFFKKYIYQVIPFFSSVKHFGYPFYIYSFFDLKNLFRMHVQNVYKSKILCRVRDIFILEIFCSHGFYVRSLINEISFLSNYPFTVFRIFRLSIGNYNIINSFKV